MKTNLIIVAVLAVAAIGYFVLLPKNPVTETPTDTASEAKIDINAVCDGALAYMSFPDGASADAFLAECKAGNRPEVIEKYKADLNLGAGAEI